MAARPASTSDSARLSRDSIVNAALTFLDREGWDALTINALATQLGTKGPSLYNHVNSLEDLRRTVRMRVVGDIIDMLNTVGPGPHPRRRGDGDGQRLPQLCPSPSGPLFGVHPDAARRRRPRVHRGHPGGGRPGDLRAGLLRAGRENAFYAALEFWSAMHGFVLLEMTGAMNGIDTDAVFTDMVMRLATGMERR